MKQPPHEASIQEDDNELPDYDYDESQIEEDLEPEPPQDIKIIPSSGTLIDDKERIAHLKTCFNNRRVTLRRLYKASEHEFKRAPFLDLCADKGATLSVIQSENGRVFGGYTSKSWRRSHGTHVEDD